MPPEDRFVSRFAAEPPQDALPSGRWADTLQAEFLAACLRIDTEGEELGEAGDAHLVPRPHVDGPHLRAGDRAHRPRASSCSATSRSRPATRRHGDEQEPATSPPAPTSPTRLAEDNPEWRMDLCEEVIGGWRGESGDGRRR